MATIQKELVIKTKTTGFSSPAESYVDKRLDLNDLIVKDLYSTFYFKYSGQNVFNINQGDVVVVDRSETIKMGDLVILSDNDTFKIREYNGQENVWGRISWILQKL